MAGLINKDGAGRAFSGTGTRLLLRDQPGLITDVTVTREWLQKNVSGYSSPENLRIVTGFGDSMRPVFKPGDPLIVDTGHTTISFDAVYFFRVDGEGFVKRLQRVPGEGIRVLSSNKAYESWTVKPEMDFEVLGRIIKAWTSEDF
jgi:phage repressor protein C with HTH and peptisase S24 domain